MGPILLVEFIESELQRSNKLAKSTKLNHYRTLDILKKNFYSQKLEKVDYDFADRFDNKLREIFNSLTTVERHHDTLRRYIKIANRKRRISNDNFQNFLFFEVQRVRKEKIALTQDELNKLDQLRHQLPPFNYRDKKALRAFLFACYTGLRYQDVYQIKEQNIYENEGITYLKKDMQKLKRMQRSVTLPISVLFNGKPLEILQEEKHYNRYFEGVSDINRHLKRLAKNAKITPDISFHTARHTFLTMIAEKTGNVFIVMKLGGITQIGTAEKYIHLAHVREELKLKNIEW